MTAAVSIVIPCYNQARFVVDAIRSAASFPNVEVIVVDDGSTDETSGAAGSVAGVRVIRQANRGLAGARNRGLFEATTEFVVFLDADDRLLPGALDVGLAVLRANPGAAFAFGRCVMMSVDGTPLPTPERPRIAGDVHAALLADNPLWTPAVAIFRREHVVAAGGFRRGSDAAADYDLYLRLTATRAAVDHWQVVAAYRRHDANMSGRAALMLRETLSVLKRNRPADPRLLAFWRAGLAHWKDFYGTQLVEEIRSLVKQRAFAEATARTVTLFRHAPSIARRELGRKLRVSFGHAGRATPDAEIVSAIRRADTSSGN